MWKRVKPISVPGRSGAATDLGRREVYDGRDPSTAPKWETKMFTQSGILHRKTLSLGQLVFIDSDKLMISNGDHPETGEMSPSRTL